MDLKIWECPIFPIFEEGSKKAMKSYLKGTDSSNILISDVKF